MTRAQREARMSIGCGPRALRGSDVAVCRTRVVCAPEKCT
jgi:hypothetical protein